MSFYLLPAVSYQTQQKMKKKVDEKKKQLAAAVEEDEDNTKNQRSSVSSGSSGRHKPPSLGRPSVSSHKSSSSGSEKKPAPEKEKRGLFGRSKKSTPVNSSTSIPLVKDKKLSASSDVISLHTTKSSHSSHSRPNTVEDVGENADLVSMISNGSDDSAFSGSKKKTKRSATASSKGSGSNAFNYNFNSDLKDIANFEKSLKKKKDPGVAPSESPRSRQMSVTSLQTNTSNPPLFRSLTNGSSKPRSSALASDAVSQYSVDSPDPKEKDLGVQVVIGETSTHTATTSSSGSIFDGPTFNLSDMSFITNLDWANNGKVEKASLCPEYQINKYKAFMKFQENHHDYDSITFSEIRLNSLLSFVKNYEKFGKRLFKLKLHFYEFVVENHLRINEELLQLNYLNFLKLCTDKGMEDLDQLATENKIASERDGRDSSPSSEEQGEDGDPIKRSSFSEETRGAEGDYSTAAATFASRQPSVSSRTDYLDLTTRILTEFNLIELYAFQVIKKFNGNSSVNVSIEKAMVEKFHSILAKFEEQKQLQGNIAENNSNFAFIPGSKISQDSAPKFEPLRVLHYNKIFSSQLSWQLAIDLPFAEVYESGIHNEGGDFTDSNIGMVKSKVTKLDKEDHGKLHEMMQNLHVQKKPNMGTKLKFHLQSGASGDQKFRPINCFNARCGLMEMPDSHFDLIQSRDLFFQCNSKQVDIALHEFYRILKPDGFLELPMSEVKVINGPPEVQKNYETLVNFLTGKMQLIPNSSEVIVEKLKNAGFRNVKYVIISLSSENSFNDYLIKFFQFRLFDLIGYDKLSRYWSKQKTENWEEGLHYSVHVIAQK